MSILILYLLRYQHSPAKKTNSCSELLKKTPNEWKIYQSKNIIHLGKIAIILQQTKQPQMLLRRFRIAYSWFKYKIQQTLASHYQFNFHTVWLLTRNKVLELNELKELSEMSKNSSIIWIFVVVLSTLIVLGNGQPTNEQPIGSKQMHILIQLLLNTVIIS